MQAVFLYTLFLGIPRLLWKVAQASYALGLFFRLAFTGARSIGMLLWQYKRKTALLALSCDILMKNLGRLGGGSAQNIGLFKSCD